MLRIYVMKMLNGVVVKKKKKKKRVETFGSKAGKFPVVGDADGEVGLKLYDPVKNYLSPRPKFLRYNPNRRRKILKENDEERVENVIAKEGEVDDYERVKNVIAKQGIIRDLDARRFEKVEVNHVITSADCTSLGILKAQTSLILAW
ncbi:hypothetical protein Tco_1260406, partial [Tanacetum coccineum]